MFSEVISRALAQIQYTKEPRTLYEPLDYILQLGGKRMRPLLALMSYGMFRDDLERAARPALTTEVFHNFTLIHDDIMDNAPLRRGKPTVHEKWNTNTALLSGDVMLVKAYDLLLDAPSETLPEIIRYFNKCAVEVCEGQQYDMGFEEREDVTISEYIEMIRLKTAVLLGFSLRLGGMLAGVSVEVASQLDELGNQAGIGFQLMDDLLDVYADPDKFGKQVGGDILEDKKTFLLLRTQQKAKGDTAKALQNWLNAKDADPTQKVQGVRAIYDELGIREETITKMNEYFQQAFATLEAIPAEPKRKEPLKALLEKLSKREY